MSNWRVSWSIGRSLFPLCELKYIPLICFVHVLICAVPSIEMVVPVTDFDGNRKRLPTKLFPGATKWTRENLLPKDWTLILGKLSRSVFPIAYIAHTIIVRVMTIFLFIWWLKHKVQILFFIFFFCCFSLWLIILIKFFLSKNWHFKNIFYMFTQQLDISRQKILIGICCFFLCMLSKMNFLFLIKIFFFIPISLWYSMNLNWLSFKNLFVNGTFSWV